MNILQQEEKNEPRKILDGWKKKTMTKGEMVNPKHVVWALKRL